MLSVLLYQWEKYGSENFKWTQISFSDSKFYILKPVMFQEYTVFPTAPQPNIEERHGYPRQYSCLENLWTEEPGGL